METIVKGKLKIILRPHLIAVLTLLGAMVFGAMTAPHAFAAGDAYFTLSPSGGSYKVGNSFTVTVYEYSSAGDNTEGVQANLSYNSSLLQWQSNTAGAFSALCGQNSGGGGSVNFGCAATSTLSGTQPVVSISFKVLASGTASVNMVSGPGATPTDILNSSEQSVWDGSLKSANFSLSASSTSSGSTSTKSSTPSSSKSTTPSLAPAPKPTPNPSPTPTSTTQPGGASNQADNAAITIIVTDTNGQPIKNAKVTLDNKMTMYTDTQGKANFSVESAGSHAVTVTAPGKKTYQTRVTLAANESVPLELQLTSASSSGLIFGIVGVVGLLLIAGGVFYFFRPKLPWARDSGQFIPPSAASQPPVVGFNSSQPSPPAPRPSAPAQPAATAANVPQHRATTTSGFDSLDGMRRKF